MQKLLHKVQEFRRDEFPKKAELFTRLDQGQQPEVLLITCSDSRISPNLITNTDPGELFIIRNAGNIVPKHDEGLGEAATIEYAVKALGIKDIIVCGHSQCGAMAAVLNPSACDSLPAVGKWLAGSQGLVERAKKRHPDASDEDLFGLVIQENVIAQLETLQQHPCVAEAIEKGEMNLHGWVYSIGTGDVSVLDAGQGTFDTMDKFV